LGGDFNLDVLRGIFAESRGDRRSFLLRVLGLGISIPAAYAALGLLGNDDDAVAARKAELETLERKLAAHPGGKVVAPEAGPGDAADASGADEPGVAPRIERLRRRYAAEREAPSPGQLSGRLSSGKARPAGPQLSQEDWGNWNNWENWNNWDNWQNWDNWGNGGG
jgi:hypothetical protein